MTLLPDHRDPKNPGAHDCHCTCHLTGAKHVMPCCYPCPRCGYDTRGDQEEHDKTCSVREELPPSYTEFGAPWGDDNPGKDYEP